MAPFSHTYISPQSERRLCCASREESSYIQQYIDAPGESKTEYNPTTLQEHWNSEHLKSVRRRMLAGEELPECEICNHNILNLHNYRRYFNETLFPDLIEEAIANTDETGYTTMQPISFDYRLSNQCNFKCRMCGQQLSSAWETEKRKYNDWSPKNDPWMVPENRNKIEEFQTTQVLAELEEAIDNKTIREMYWVGGEPLMWPDHWRLMDKMIANGVAKEVVIRYNTNLSRVDWRGKNLFQDYIRHFKRTNICASIDGAGEIGEFIRTGLKWNQWLSNFEKGLSFGREMGYGRDFMVMDLTLTLPGILGLKELMEHAHRLDCKMYTKIMFAFDPSIVLSPFSPPRRILKPLLLKTIEECKDLTIGTRSSVTETLREMIERPTFEALYPDTYQEAFFRGREVQHRLEERRGGVTLAQIYQRHSPELFAWWTQ